MIDTSGFPEGFSIELVNTTGRHARWELSESGSVISQSTWVDLSDSPYFVKRLLTEYAEGMRAKANNLAANRSMLGLV